MKSLPHLLGISLLAICVSSPGSAETRSIKIGVLNDASRPYSDNGGEGSAVIRKLKEAPIDDDLFGRVIVRPDGRAIHNMYIFKLKLSSASHGKWDLLEQVGVLTGPEAFRPLDEGGGSLVEPPKQLIRRLPM